MDIKTKIIQFRDELQQCNNHILFNKLCDQFFDYNYTSIEQELKNLNAPPQLYLGNTLKEEALNTSWYDYYQLIKISLKYGIKLLDVGSGYSKGTLLALTLGHEHFHSVECVHERINWAKDKANELELNTNLFYCSDVLLFDLNQFDAFFIYQPTGNFLSDLLNKVLIQANKYIWAIESHGDLISRLDYDNRLIHKKSLLTFSSKRHDNILYSYLSHRASLSPIIEFEISLYKEKYLEISDENSIYGEFKWVSSLQGSFIDYLNEVATLEVNGKRISLKENIHRLRFIPTLNEFQKKYINQEYIDYLGQGQRIIRIITYPNNALELSISGKVAIGKIEETGPKMVQ